MNEFQKALLEAVNTDFADISEKKKRHHLRRSILIAAAAIALIGTAFAAYVIKHPIGNVNVETDEQKIFGFELPETDNNEYYSLTFRDLQINPDAPQNIETYFLPLDFVDGQPLQIGQTFIEDYDSMQGDHTFFDDPSELNVDYSEIDGVNYGWETEQYGYIYFSQRCAKTVSDDTALVHHVLPDDEEQQASHRTFEIGEYSIFAFEISFPSSNEVSRTWYWSDGNYIFSLTASLSEEDMTALFESVVPVGTHYPYSIDENGVITLS